MAAVRRFFNWQSFSPQFLRILSTNLNFSTTTGKSRLSLISQCTNFRFYYKSSIFNFNFKFCVCSICVQDVFVFIIYKSELKLFHFILGHYTTVNYGSTQNGQGPLPVYDKMVQNGELDKDDYQRTIVEHLQDLYTSSCKYEPSSQGIFSKVWFGV